MNELSTTPTATEIVEITPGRYEIKFNPPLSSREAVEFASQLAAEHPQFRVVHPVPRSGRNHGVWAARRAMKATQREFASRIGYSLRQVQRVEAGRTEPTDRFTEAVVGAFDVALHEEAER